MSVCVCVVSMFSPGCGPMSGTVWPQVVRVQLGLVDSVSQGHPVETTHCEKKQKMCVCVCMYVYIYIYMCTQCTHTHTHCMRDNTALTLALAA